MTHDDIHHDHPQRPDTGARANGPAGSPQTVEERPARPLWRSLWRGLAGRCPACGTGALFAGYLKVRPACGACGEALHHQRADDAPPYFVTFIVGHLVIAAVLAVEIAYAPPIWLHAAIWIPLTLGLSMLFLPPVKGVLIGQQWALGMHGFGPREEDFGQPDPATETADRAHGIGGLAWEERR